MAALEFVLALAEHLPGVADVELVAPEPAFTYRPLAIAETFGAGVPYRFELAKLTTRIGARLRPGSIASVDAGRRIAVLSPDEQVPFDVLVVACGARAVEAVPGALTFRGEPPWRVFGQCSTRSRTGRLVPGVCGPPGTAWPLPVYELALMSAAALAQLGRTGHRLTLVTPEDAPLEQFGGAASDAVAALLAEAGVESISAAPRRRPWTVSSAWPPEARSRPNGSSRCPASWDRPSRDSTMRRGSSRPTRTGSSRVWTTSTRRATPRPSP